MYFNLLSPLLIVCLYWTPILESIVVPDYISQSIWSLFRIVFVVIAIGMRMITFREEIQFHFNESYFYVQKLMVDKDEKMFRYIKLRITENFLETWYAIFQHACNYIIPVLLVLCYINRLVSFVTVSEASLNLDYTKIVDKINAAGGLQKYDLMSD